VARTLVIAECGSCHDRSFGKSLRLIDAAVAAGADVAKFQWWSDPEQLADTRRVPLAYREIYRRYAMPEYWLSFLKDYCDCVGIELMVTTYLPADVATVAPFVKRFKIASFEADSRDHIDTHRPYWHDRDVIISEGMAPSFDWMDSDPTIGRVRFLQCVSSYPAPASAMQLAYIRRGQMHGLSDHSRHPWMGALAVAAGAEIVEAHLRLDETDPQNPDYATAFSPVEFAEYVRNIRFAETVMGDGQKKLQDCERDMAQFRVGGPQ
jgi:N,N'-diacetyllegionaminate synthase